MIEKRIFSSADLPLELNDKARFDYWVDLTSVIGPAEYQVTANVPFFARNAITRLGDVLLAQASGSISGVDRTRQHVSGNVSPNYYMFINSGAGPVIGQQGGREFSMDTGSAVLLADFEPIKMRGGGNNNWSTVFVPQSALQSAFDDVLGKIPIVVETGSESLVLLKQFSQFLVGADLKSQAVIQHAAATLTDLVGLAAGLTTRDRETASPSGLRAARLFAIEQKIAGQYDDPQISAERVALQIGLSARYVYDLLQETGTSFSERVLDLRLTKAFSMLTSPRNGQMRISDIAFVCGFSDVSYFNRCFRRRFGSTPTAAR